jgi:hypothetical protein
MCGEALRTVAQELTRAVRNNVTIGWTLRENVRAKILIMVQHILRRYGYPPDKREQATLTVLERAEVLCRDCGRWRTESGCQVFSRQCCIGCCWENERGES